MVIVTYHGSVSRWEFSQSAATDTRALLCPDSGRTAAHKGSDTTFLRPR